MSADRDRRCSARGRLAFALDYPTLEAAAEASREVGESVGVLKVGLELFVRAGPKAVSLGAAAGCDVFLDLKLHDIPRTVAGAVASACSMGIRYLTLHAGGGPRMLEAAAEAAAKENAATTLLAVTVLTSLDEGDLGAVGVSATPEAHARRLARVARDAGVGGLVCSVEEVAALREELGPDVVLVTPGIRPSGGSSDDQKRTGTPAGAISSGADLLVVGRPIKDAPSPADAARAIVSEIASAL